MKMRFKKSPRISTHWYGLLAMLLLPHAVRGLQFVSPYNNMKVTGVLGLSVNFTWVFNGGNVDSVQWGIQKDGFLNFQQLLVTVRKDTTSTITSDPPYSRRVSGAWDGSSPGQATFTLNSIQKADERLYMCRLGPESLSLPVYDSVQLLVGEAPQINISSVQSNYNEGSSVYIRCRAYGTPDPDVQWIRNGMVKSSDPPSIKEASVSIAKSWIGQTVTLKCVSDGVPTPRLTWYKPDGSQINSVIDTQSTVNVKMNVDQYFGFYKCIAHNRLAVDFKIVKIQQIKKPGSPTIAQLDIKATSLIVNWTAPANDGGSPITAYRVVVLKGSTQITSKNITDPGTISWSVGDLDRDTEYTVKVLARNAVFEGPAVEESVKTRNEVSPRTNKKSKSKVTVVEGNVLYLVCQVEGYPTPNVTWRKNDKVLQTNINKSVFIIDDTSEKDGGKYECEASNSVGTVSYTVEVTIKGSSCNETTLHIVYLIVILVLLIIILTLIIVQWRLRSGAAISNTNRNKCAECGGESVVLNPIAVKPERQSSNNTASGDSRIYADPISEEYMPLHPSGRTWEINREQVKIIKVVGKGAFSRVAKATAWNINGNKEYTTVAVKMLKANASESDRRNLLSELNLMKKLKSHPHVIKLMGCVTVSDPLLVLIEYVPYGDLLGYLRKSRGLNDTYFKDPDGAPQTSLTAEQLMRFAWQVADGMLYLSSRKIIHRDLAARNILVGEGEKCKVTDFGMARNVQKDDIYTKQSRGRLPVKWTSYEALLFGTYTTQSDVWSYGVLLYEILTVGGSPYPGINARQIARKLQEGFRMPKPKHVDDKLYQIMLKCWEENPHDRPTFGELKDTMKEMERKHRMYVNLKQYDNSLYANVDDLTAQ